MRSACLVRTRFILNNFLVGLDWGGGPRTPPLGYAPGINTELNYVTVTLCNIHFIIFYFVLNVQTA